MPPVRWERAAPDRREILLYPFYTACEGGANGKAGGRRVYFQGSYSFWSLPMPLRDHFHGELRGRRHWESFHSGWPMALVRRINSRLPPRYYGEIQVHLGAVLEADVATFEDGSLTKLEDSSNGAHGGVATAVWAPPLPAQTIAVDFPAQDVFEIAVYDDQGGRLVAAVELVSPGNKDRPENRRAFAIKCAAYLQQRVSIVVVDVVTRRRANLHVELMELLERTEAAPWPEGQDLYAAAYRTTKENDAWRLDLWPQPLALGQPATMPRGNAPNLAVPPNSRLAMRETYDASLIR